MDQDLVINTLTVPQHVCCSSPYWLYRIYQDTFVTSSEIIALIQESLIESRETLKELRTGDASEYVNILPPSVQDLQCINGTERSAGTLRARWSMPWTGVKIETWSVLIQNTGKQFVTLGNSTSFTLDGFRPTEKIYFFVRPKANGVWHEWGRRGECIV